MSSPARLCAPIVAALVFSLPLFAQTPPCVELNAAASGTVVLPVPYFGQLSVRFSPTSAFVANMASVFAGTTQGHGLSLVVRLVEPSTNAPLDPPLATAQFGGVGAPSSGWISAALTAAVPMNVADVYQFDFVAAPNPSTFPASYPLVSFPLSLADPSIATTLVPYDLSCFASVCAGVPTIGSIGLKLRLFGGQCGVAAVAHAVSIGEACQNAGPPAALQCLPPPIPGGFSTLLVSNTGLAGTPIFVFWSFGVDPIGTTTIGPFGCPIHLDRPSLDLLAAAGFEPLAQGAATGFSATGLSIGWPSDPAIAGIVLGLQAVIADLDGLPTGVAGLNLRTSNALRATIGF